MFVACGMRERTALETLLYRPGGAFGSGLSGVFRADMVVRSAESVLAARYMDVSRRALPLVDSFHRLGQISRIDSWSLKG